jgi:uncharacterized glyoxalase superfamily protein PhnB
MEGIEGFITFTYHENIDNAAKFYGETLELELVLDRDWVKIFRIGKDSHIGLVDSEKGYLKPATEKPVMLSIFVRDVDYWYSKLRNKGVRTNNPPKNADEIDMKGFLTWDPSGYVIEIFEFLTKPYGEK